MGGNNRLLDRWGKRALEIVLRPFFRRRRHDFDQILATRPRSILIVRQHNQMGDMLCTTPAFRAIRQRFPGARIVLVASVLNEGVVRGNPDLDEILVFDKRRARRSPRWAWRFWRALRRRRFDLAIVLNTVSFSSTSAWIGALSGARFLIGGDSTGFGWSFSRWLYDLEMPAGPGAGGHAVDHALDALAAIGIPPAGREPVLIPGPEAEERAAAFLRSLGGRWPAAVHPGAGKERNRWPAERFARAIEALESWGATVYLIEGPADAHATAQTLRALGSDRPVLRGVDIPTVGAALRRSSVALVNDTGVMHIAGAVQTPAVALFATTSSEEWGPPSPAMVCLQSPDGTMAGLGLDLVLPALRERFEHGRAARP